MERRKIPHLYTKLRCFFLPSSLSHVVFVLLRLLVTKFLMDFLNINCFYVMLLMLDCFIHRLTSFCMKTKSYTFVGLMLCSIFLLYLIIFTEIRSIYHEYFSVCKCERTSIYSDHRKISSYICICDWKYRIYVYVSWDDAVYWINVSLYSVYKIYSYNEKWSRIHLCRVSIE